MDAAVEAMTKVFGVASVSRAAGCEKSREAIAARVVE
jgi:adenylyl- and sulfurtransferase ThiI